MNSFSKWFIEKPIRILLAANILVGLFVFRDYGFSWDEPLFYDYADALGYAYSPREWLSGNFDVNNSYGSSGDDHKTRGPAYLLLAREPVYLLEAFGLDQASAWHLINFLFFQIGVYFFYRLTSRWMKPAAAVAAAAFFSWQPLLWGHAFINPKDPPFLVLFLASVYLGFEMVDRLSEEAVTNRQKISSTLLPAIVLGITTSIRVLGPLAGLLIFIYALWNFRRNLTALILPFAVYGGIAVLTILVTWPFLWEAPLTRFFEVFSFMSDNPTNLSVLFAGQVYRAGELPRRYLPFMLVTTLTEPVWPLFFLGLLLGYWKFFKQIRTRDASTEEHTGSEGWISLRSSLDFATARNNLASLTLILLWLALPVTYALIRKPAMYDGLRHFLFILPPIFIFTGFVFEFLIDHITSLWLCAGAILALLLPGTFSIAQLHPYQYTYYNSFIGGTSGASRQYETDYWLTCYKDAVEELNQTIDDPINLYVHREAYIAAYYADHAIQVRDLRGMLAEVQSGDYVLVNTRSNEDRRVFKDAQSTVEVRRGNALFCVIKQIP